MLKEKAKAQLLNWLGVELEYQDGELWNIFFDGHQIPSGANSFAGNMHRLRQIEKLQKAVKLFNILHAVEFVGLMYCVFSHKAVNTKKHRKPRQPFREQR